ncbi:MAG: hypothetical protein ACTSUD_09005 [Alphaproteobacteria bacterium]
MQRRFLLTLTLLAAISACQQGGNIAVEPAQTALAENSVSASVIDQRPYVVNGNESERLFGMTVSRWGKNTNLVTESGRPLAEDLTTELLDALDQRGFTTVGLKLRKGTSEAAAVAAFQPHATKRLVVVQIYEFQIKAINRVGARWHLEAFVYDRSGNMLARRATRGLESLGKVGRDSNGADIAMTEIIRRLLALLDEPVISGALN